MRSAARNCCYFLLTTCVAVLIGLLLVNLIKPGIGLPPEVKTRLAELYSGQTRQSIEAAEKTTFGIQTFIEIIPKNPIAAASKGDMLAVIFFALMFGIALTRLPAIRSGPVLSLLTGVSEAMVGIIEIAMRFAPIGVGALTFSVTSRFGFDLLLKLGLYVLTVIGGLAIVQFGLFSLLVWRLGGMSPRAFFQAAESAMLTAFSTSSSSATLPTTLNVAEKELGIQKEIAGFVVPLGATMNMNGTAVFEGVTVLFLAQVFGVPLSLGNQLVVLIMTVLMAVGTAGVPGGTIPLMILILSTVGVPGEGIALIMGVDRFLDMCRTTVNVTGDLTAAVCVARTEGMLRLGQPHPPTHRPPE